MGFLLRNPFALKLLLFGLIGYYGYLLIVSYPRKSKYKITDVQLAHLKILAEEGVWIIKKIEKEKFLFCKAKSGKIIKDWEFYETWHPAYLLILSFMEVGDCINLKNEIKQRERR